MISLERTIFNDHFSEDKYHKFIQNFEQEFGKIPFRIAESPVFISNDLKQKLIKAGEEIINTIKRPDFKKITENAIPKNWEVPNENSHPHFLTFDFGICEDNKGILYPKLIELQGFPSLYAFQPLLAKNYEESYPFLSNYTPFFNHLNEDSYFELLRKVIIGPYHEDEVALMDVDAPAQKTAIDFYLTHQKLGLPILAMQDIFKEKNELFYYKDNVKIKLKRIYNRLIFDEIADRKSLLKQHFDPRKPLDIEWITHPNWFYRISKYLLPYLKGESIPETHFLKDILQNLPQNLGEYVLKPLFSFSGKGVIIDVGKKDIDGIKDPENWILQKKVTYASVVKSPTAASKVEIRLMYIWPDNEEPQLCITIARLSMGKMIGVSYNKDYKWVGGSVGLIEKTS